MSEAAADDATRTRKNPVTTANSDPRVPVYRVVDPTEFSNLRATGDYGSNPAQSGKYFALTPAGAQAFASHPSNAGSTVTGTTLPRSVVRQGFLLNDPGRYGAGPSVFFAEQQLTMVYAAMTPPTIVPNVGQIT